MGSAGESAASSVTRPKLDRVGPGTRAAVNLSGIRTEDLRRGMVLAARGSLAPVHAVDVRLQSTSLLHHPLAHNAGVTFLSATSESEAKLRLLDRDEIVPGESAWAQVVLDHEVAVLPRDHCIIRTPNETVAGGPIVTVNPRRRRRNHAPALEALERQLEGTPGDRLADALTAGPMPRADVAKALGVEEPEAAAAIDEVLERGDAIERGGRLVGAVWLRTATGTVLEEVANYLERNPAAHERPA